MSSLEDTFEEACRQRLIPGAVLLAADRSGKFKYEKVFGSRSLKSPDSNEPLEMDAMMWYASCTKLMTCISVLQCVERGVLNLDEDVTTILPELKGIEILTGFDTETGKPITTKATKNITLRHLLTHSSGMSYDVFDPVLQQWRASQGQQIGQGKTVASKYDCPLLYEPGTAWGYSPAIDWAGKMVERVNDNISLQDYMKTHVWGPLGIKDMIFHLRDRPDLVKRLADLSMRDPSGSGKVLYVDDPGFRDDVDDALGGGGVFANAPEYLKVLQSILADDGKLLKSESVEKLFEPNLTKESQQALMKLLEDKQVNNQLGGMPLGTAKNWSLGGLLIQEDLPGWRRHSTLTWGGLPNLTWFIDRKVGLCGLYASQVIPPGDPKSVEMSGIFERAVYEMYAGVAPRI
ncbi:hypothetical protein MMC11_000207 [Xylographa trunciseda]|nr:hypothetical protein [Xylographa trunciseda]